jgi:DNA-directed RNA polymerase subunit K/omega
MIDRSKVPNTFEFVVTAGARARQLMAGSRPRVETGGRKNTTIATEEVITRAVEKIAAEKIVVEKTGASTDAVEPADTVE